jgi:PAS domain-containing protein
VLNGNESKEWVAYIQGHMASLRSEVDPEIARREALAVLDNTYAELSVTAEELEHQSAHLENIAARGARLERRHTALLELMRDGVLETDEAGTIKQASRGLARRLSVREEFLLNKPLLVFIWEREYQMLHNALRKVTLGPIQDWEIHLQPRNGPTVKVKMSAMRLEPDSTSPAGILWLFRDP